MHLFSYILLFTSIIITPFCNGFIKPIVSLYRKNDISMDFFENKFNHIKPFIPLNNLFKSPISNFQMEQKINIYELPYIDKKNTSCILFFTGGNSIISHEFYSNFLNLLFFCREI